MVLFSDYDDDLETVADLHETYVHGDAQGHVH